MKKEKTAKDLALEFIREARKKVNKNITAREFLQLLAEYEGELWKV